MSTQGTLERLQPASGDATGNGNYAKGSSDDDSMKASFPASPIYDGTLNGTYIVTQFQAVLDGDQTANVDFDGGVNMDYGSAPTLSAGAPVTSNGLSSGYTDTAGDGKGMPAGPFVPTTASPGIDSETGAYQTNPDGQPGVAPVAGHGGDLGTVDSPQGSRANYQISTPSST